MFNKDVESRYFITFSIWRQFSPHVLGVRFSMFLSCIFLCLLLANVQKSFAKQTKIFCENKHMNWISPLRPGEVDVRKIMTRKYFLLESDKKLFGHEHRQWQSRGIKLSLFVQIWYNLDSFVPINFFSFLFPLLIK